MYLPKYYRLQLRVMSWTAFGVFRCRYLVRTLDGRDVVGEMTVTTVSAGTMVSSEQVIPGGELISVSVLPDASPNFLFGARALVRLAPSAGVGNFPELDLMEGPCDVGIQLSWIGGRVTHTGSAPDVVSKLPISTPGLGSSAVLPTTNFAIRDLVSAGWTGVTGVAVATRTAYMYATVESEAVVLGSAQLVQVAGSTRFYYVGAGLSTVASTGDAFAVTGSGSAVPANQLFVVTYANMQVNDQLDSIFLLARWTLQPGT